jgi:hypothetical protein
LCRGVIERIDDRSQPIEVADQRNVVAMSDLLISDERGWEGSVAKLCDLSMRSTRKVGGRRAIGVRIERILK